MAAQALLCDLGGVLIAVSFDRVVAQWARAAGGPPASIAERFAMDREWTEFEAGRLTEKDYLAHLRKQYGVELADHTLVDGWNDIYQGINNEVEELLRDVRGHGYRVVAVTNTNVIHQRFWRERFAVPLRVFHSVYSSCDMGCRKPERAFFERVASSEGLSLHEAVFVDDTKENVVGARQAGLVACLYVGARQMRADLRRHGLVA